MAHSLLHKFVTLLLLAVVIAASVAGLCRETHATERCWGHDAGKSSCSLVGADDHCPSCPAGENSGHSDCDSSCYCSCNLPLTSSFGFSVHAPHVSSLVPLDSFFRFPEVYLPKFIPPQLHA
ncbi:hypothetical protein [Geobacter sp. AOG1]|uniref:hypothetical protein n=1 Tax=Geobacter sp. AOG1 TaxID=1566346 RepID=UPI001CC620F1|nr:hypothetical protein [Geobacter sp. AOG1]GFE59395.1 hypothetical protein AOG1_32750 [Geobacter sp. AOG1]